MRADAGDFGQAATLIRSANSARYIRKSKVSALRAANSSRSSAVKTPGGALTRASPLIRDSQIKFPQGKKSPQRLRGLSFRLFHYTFGAMI